MDGTRQTVKGKEIMPASVSVTALCCRFSSTAVLVCVAALKLQRQCLHGLTAKLLGHYWDNVGLLHCVCGCLCVA